MTIVLGAALILVSVLPRDTALELSVAGVTIKSAAPLVDICTVLIALLMARLAWVMAQGAQLAAVEGAALLVRLSTDADKDVAQIERTEGKSLNPMLRTRTAPLGVNARLYWIAAAIEGWGVYLLLTGVLSASAFAVVRGAWTMWKHPSVPAPTAIGMVCVLGVSTCLMLCSVAQYWLLRRRTFDIDRLFTLDFRSLPTRFSLTDFAFSILIVGVLFPIFFLEKRLWRPYVGPLLRRHRPSSVSLARKVLQTPKPEEHQPPDADTYVIFAVQFARLRCEVIGPTRWSNKSGNTFEIGSVFSRVEPISVNVTSGSGVPLFNGPIGPSVFSDRSLKVTLERPVDGVDFSELASKRRAILIAIGHFVLRPVTVVLWHDGGILIELRELKLDVGDFLHADYHIPKGGLDRAKGVSENDLFAPYFPVVQVCGLFETFGIKEPDWSFGTPADVKTRAILEALAKIAKRSAQGT